MTYEVDSPGEINERGKVSRRTLVRRAATRLAVVVGVLIFLIVFLSPDIFVSIGPGDVGVLYLRFFGGTQTDKVLGEGIKVIPPWDRIYIYTVRVQEVKHEMQVLTAEGLSLTLFLSTRYHPERETVGLLHQRVGPDYKERIVIPEVESALREIMGHFKIHEVYGSERGLIQKVINESLEGVSQRYVRIDDIILRHVELPAKVREAVEEKMTQLQLTEAYEYKLDREKQEAKRKEIEANGYKKYNEILNASLTPQLLRWKGIEATKELAKSPNSKIIFVGNRGNDLPILLGADK